VLACVGLVPLLIALDEVPRVRGGLRYVYTAMLVFHVITLNWTGGYMHSEDPYMMIAGGITMTLHPFFYFVPLGIYLWVKGRWGRTTALALLPVLWVGYEYSHTLGEWSFPWLTLGNSQSYDLARVQVAAFTGVLGLSFWILVVNVVALAVLDLVARDGPLSLFRGAGRLPAALLVLLVLAPGVAGTIILSGAPPPGAVEGRPLTVGMVQSNMDPWRKWEMSAGDQVRLYLDRTRALALLPEESRPDLVLWPETAVNSYLLTPPAAHLLHQVQSALDSLGVPVVTGMPHAVIYPDSTTAPRSARRSKLTGERYEVYNAAALITPRGGPVAWYGKMKMVPLAERVPYADMFSFLDVLRWNVGVGGWQIGPERVIFREPHTGASFCTMICYESTYPGFVADFVRRGAEFIAVITIDSWWGRMSGAWQHHQFAVFRAVENRRWVARCAVGGFSSFIDPWGRVLDKTELFTEAMPVRTIGRRSDLTLFTLMGDWLGLACGLGAVVVVLALLLTRRRPRHTDPPGDP
jgi:apolipoprotein N-acyltransferase